MRIGNEWDGFTVAPKEVLDAGDTVIGHRYYSGTYKKSGKDVRAQFAHFFSFRDGKIIKFQQYTDTHSYRKQSVNLENNAVAPRPSPNREPWRPGRWSGIISLRRYLFVTKMSVRSSPVVTASRF